MQHQYFTSWAAFQFFPQQGECLKKKQPLLAKVSIKLHSPLFQKTYASQKIHIIEQLSSCSKPVLQLMFLFSSSIKQAITYLHSNSILNTFSMFFQWMDCAFTCSKEKRHFGWMHLSGPRARHLIGSGGVQMHLVQSTDAHVRVGFSCGADSFQFFNLQELTCFGSSITAAFGYLLSSLIGTGSPVCRSVAIVKIILTLISLRDPSPTLQQEVSSEQHTAPLCSVTYL